MEVEIPGARIAAAAGRNRHLTASPLRRNGCSPPKHSAFWAIGRDVKRHIGNVVERSGEPLPAEVSTALAHWDSTNIDSAVVGQPAPDFALETVGGQQVRLSDFRGKHPVVLVFLYGDT